MISSSKQFVSQYLLVLSLVVLGAGLGMAENKGRIPAGEADPEAKREGKKKSDRPSRDMDHRRAFSEADANKDGFVSLEEFAQMKRLERLAPEKRERLFAFLDKNKDGKLHHRELHPSPFPKLEPVIKQFSRLDADESGGLSIKELAQSAVFKNTPADHLDRMFRKLDRNQNKQLEKKEIINTGPRGRPAINFKQYDKDESGGLSFEEYSAMPFMDRVKEERRKKVFDRIDANNDQQLSPDEIKNTIHRHRGRDLKGKPGAPKGEGKRRDFGVF